MCAQCRRPYGPDGWYCVEVSRSVTAGTTTVSLALVCWRCDREARAARMRVSQHGAERAA